MSYRGHDGRIESICANCALRGKCLYARDTNVICNNFVKDKDDD